MEVKFTLTRRGRELGCGTHVVDENAGGYPLTFGGGEGYSIDSTHPVIGLHGQIKLQDETLYLMADCHDVISLNGKVLAAGDEAPLDYTDGPPDIQIFGRTWTKLDIELVRAKTPTPPPEPSRSDVKLDDSNTAQEEQAIREEESSSAAAVADAAKNNCSGNESDKSDSSTGSRGSKRALKSARGAKDATPPKKCKKLVQKCKPPTSTETSVGFQDKNGETVTFTDTDGRLVFRCREDYFEVHRLERGQPDTHEESTLLVYGLGAGSSDPIRVKICPATRVEEVFESLQKLANRLGIVAKL